MEAGNAGRQLLARHGRLEARADGYNRAGQHLSLDDFAALGPPPFRPFAGEQRRIIVVEPFAMAQEALAKMPFLAKAEGAKQGGRGVIGRGGDGHEAVDAVVRDEMVEDRAYRSEEHTSELQSLMRSSYAVF